MNGFTFDHINISVEKSGSAAEFFQKVLGFENGYRPPFPFDGKWLYEGKQALIHVIDLPNNGEQTRFGHVAFRTEEPIEKILEKIESLGLNYRQAAVPEDGQVQTFVDLNGLVIELITPSQGKNIEEKEYELPTF